MTGAASGKAAVTLKSMASTKVNTIRLFMMIPFILKSQLHLHDHVSFRHLLMLLRRQVFYVNDSDEAESIW